MPYVFTRVVFLNIMTLGFIQVVEGISSSFLLLIILLQIYYSLLFHLPVSGLSGCFQFGAIMNKAL